MARELLRNDCSERTRRREREQMNGAKSRLADVEASALSVVAGASVLPLTASTEPGRVLLNAPKNRTASASQVDLGGATNREVESISTMTCRIDRRVIGQDCATLYISGRITEECVDTLRALLEQEKGVVAIDLNDVLIVDREAIKLLAMRESNGVELRNCPAYIREWVTREKASGDVRGTKKAKEGLQR